MSNRHMNGKPKKDLVCFLLHLLTTHTFISPNKRNEKALDTINKNMRDQHHQMRSELQDRHTDIQNNVNEYTTCM